MHHGRVIPRHMTIGVSLTQSVHSCLQLWHIMVCDCMAMWCLQSRWMLYRQECTWVDMADLMPHERNVPCAFSCGPLLGRPDTFAHVVARGLSDCFQLHHLHVVFGSCGCCTRAHYLNLTPAGRASSPVQASVGWHRTSAAVIDLLWDASSTTASSWSMFPCSKSVLMCCSRNSSRSWCP